MTKNQSNQLYLKGALPCVTDLSLKQKIAQLFAYGVFPKGFDIERSNRVTRFVETYGIGSIHLAYGSLDQTHQVRSHLDTLAIERCGIPILFGADFEQGMPHSFDGGTELPWQMAIGAGNDPEQADQAGYIAGREAAALGIHMIYGPVTDVTSNPDNHMLISRSSGQYPDGVARCVTAYVKTVQSTGTIATLKHFPGHGHAVEDSHVALPVDKSTQNFIRYIHLKPFIAGIKAGAGAIMTGHVIMDSIDSKVPATLSHAVLTDLLRNELGFDGIIITDSLNMHAIRKCLDQRRAVSALQTLKAGADIVLHPKTLESTLMFIKTAVETGELAEPIIDIAVERVLAAKRKILKTRSSQSLNGLETHCLKAHHKTAKDIADASITLVSGQHALYPIVQKYQTGKNGIELLEIIDDMDRETTLVKPFSDIIKGASQQVQVHQIRESLADDEMLRLNQLLQCSSGGIIVAVYCPMMWYKGRTLLSDAFTKKIQILLEKLEVDITVVFGSPYILSGLPGLLKLCAYGPDAHCQKSAGKVVLGKLSPKGKLPVKRETN